jgi:hypothetical protein
MTTGTGRRCHASATLDRGPAIGPLARAASRRRHRRTAVMACKYSPLGTPRGRYDEHSSKSSLSCETKVYQTSRRKSNFRR